MTTFRITRVYTRTGDDGSTALVGGERVSKADKRVEAYGTIDELNAILGLAKEELDTNTTSLKTVIEFLQQELFDLGAEVATADPTQFPQMWRANSQHVAHMERLCDHFNTNLPELTSFILPGGSNVSAIFHVARTIARRAERTLVELQSNSPHMNKHIVAYINRLSDLLFILARWSLAQSGKTSPVWVQEKDRKSPISG